MAKKKEITRDELREQVLKLVDMESKVIAYTRELKKFKRQMGISHSSIISMYDVEYISESILKNKDDELEVFKSCLDNVTLVLSYFQYRIENNAKRKLAFESLLNYPDELFEEYIKEYNEYDRNNFTPEEIQAIYDKHGQFLFDSNKRAPRSIFNYCKFFKKQVTEEQLQFLVDSISRRRLENMIKELKNHSILKLRLTQSMVDQLEAAELALELLNKKRAW